MRATLARIARLHQIDQQARNKIILRTGRHRAAQAAPETDDARPRAWEGQRGTRGPPFHHASITCSGMSKFA